MRTSKTVRRTFVKTVGNPEGGESISQVSSERMIKRDGSQAKRMNSGFSSSAGNTSTSSAPESISAPSPRPRQKVDSNMDMFRNMAKKIRK